jgi:hypothetical protein
MIEFLVILVIGFFIDMKIVAGIAGGIVGLFIVTDLIAWIDIFASFRVRFINLSKTQFYRLVVICFYAILFPIHAYRGTFSSFSQETFFGAGISIILFAVCTLFFEKVNRKIFDIFDKTMKKVRQ